MRLLLSMLLIIAGLLLAPVSFALCAILVGLGFFVGSTITARDEEGFMAGLFFLGILGVIAQIVVG